MAAMAFDIGQVMLSKRAQQNASDAAALAGARYVAAAACKAAPSLSNPACNPAVEAALKVAQLNGYGDGSTNCFFKPPAADPCPAMNTKVMVQIPPGPEAAEYYNVAGAVEVQIGSVRGAIFSGIPGLGMTSWKVGAMATAANQVDIALSFSFLALDPDCPSVLLSGANGSGLTAGGDVQVNATCAGGLKVTGNSSITVTSGACNVSGPSIQKSGNAQVNCTVNTNQPVVPDPLAGLASPDMPPLAQSPVEVNGAASAPPNCPSTLLAPQTCQFPNSSAYTGTHWRLYPGTYPGGLSIQADATFYLEPGIYFIAGGGLQMNGGGPTALSVDAGGTTLGGGILIYNTTDTAAGSPCSGSACGGSITLNGSQATVSLLPYQLDPYKGMVIFQDRTLDTTITLNGSSSSLNVTGTVYAPLALVKINGSNSTAMNTQVIAYDFQFNGSGGNMTVGYDADSFFHIRGSGLVK